VRVNGRDGQNRKRAGASRFQAVCRLIKVRSASGVATIVAGLLLGLGLATSALADTSAVTTIPGPPIAAPELAAATPNAFLTGIGSDGGEGVWFSDLEPESNPEAKDIAYVTHYSPAATGLTRVALNPPGTDSGRTWGITPGANGEELFARFDENEIGRITAKGKLKNTPLPPEDSNPQTLVDDKQGTIWFLSRGHGCELVKLAHKHKLVTYTLGSDCYALTIGPDGNIWVAVYSSNYVAEVSASTGEIIARYNLRLPVGIATLGEDVYVSEDGPGEQSNPGQIAAISPSGEITEYVLPEGRAPEWLTAGPDGAMWFTERAGPVAGSEGIGRLTPNGELSEVSVGERAPADIAATEHAIYFTRQDGPEAGVVRIPLSGFVPPPSSSYVALGDSYSSGEGNPPYEPGTDEEGIPDLCHRSLAAYGPLLDQGLNLGAMTFKACSGAVTNDFFSTNAKNPTEPPQLSWLHPGTKTVTLTIGGNDAGFPWVLKHCVVMVPPVPNGFGCSTNTRLELETQARMDALAGGSYATTPPPESYPIHSVLSIIQAIHSDAPAARIVVGLYPTLFGKKKADYAFNIAAPSQSACEVGNIFGDALWISYKDAQWLNKRGEQLDKLIKNAVAAAAHAGTNVSYAKPSQFIGHGFCDELERWFHPLELTIKHLSELEPEWPEGKASSFHPTIAGQQLGYEAAFAEKLG
jgi:streptogramin lyase/lysophospholipase L1-like esterase